MKKIIQSIILLSGVVTSAQTTLNSVITESNKVVTDPVSITLLSGFQANSANIDSFHAYIASGTGGGSGGGTTNPSTGLSSTENYIQSRVYLEPVTASSSTAKQMQTVQYFDGLGRTKQIVNVKASPLGRDVVTHIEYDQFGRQVRDYLPVPQSSTQNGAIFPTPLSNATQGDIYGNEKIYGEKVLENSPLDRIQQQIQVGTDWSTKPVKFEYDANISGEVVKYTTTTTWENNATKSTINHGGTYGANQLYKNTVIDEDGNKTIEFKNGQGQTVLVRKVVSSTENADTYYVYNEYNQLAWVIPPLLSKMQTWGFAEQQALAYEYRYDGRNRLVEKKLPGKDWEYMVYDKQDRLVLTQDANLRNLGQWLFTKYDQFSRPIYTGILDSYGSRAAQANVIASSGSNNELRSTSSWNNSGMDIYYSNTTAYPTANFKVLTVNYYDTYPAGSPAIPVQVLGQTVLSQNAQDSKISTKSLPIASYIKNTADDNWTKNYTWYDHKGRSIGTHSVNHLGGYTKTESLLDFSGTVQKMNTYHKRRENENGVNIKERFVYDHQNRLLKHYHQVDAKSEELLTENNYNELSQLKTKKVGNNLQSIDYAYNIRGWLTDINKDQMIMADMGGKLFSYKIKYTRQEGIQNPDPALFPGKNVKARYNGNIAEVDWRVVEAIGSSPSLIPKRYGYAYDNLNRLSAGYYQDPYNPYSMENIESLDYDLNGNISKLYRTGVKEGGNTTATVIDKLKYTYVGNQLTAIQDETGNPTGYEGGGLAIGYDPNGNMKNMPDKKISSIQYNFLNLPSKITFTGTQDLKYQYRADGVKIEFSSPKTECGIMDCYTMTDTTQYLDGFQYLNRVKSGGSNGVQASMSSELSRAMEIQAFSLETDISSSLKAGTKTVGLQFFPTAEGFYDYQKEQYIYQYKDHLGNVRISFGRNSAGALQIKDRNDYYPFGMNHLNTGNAFFAQSSYKNYKYNGKELQESGMYDYGARFYMPEIGRWGILDPRSQYTHEAYSYVWNNPITFNDPTGMEGEGAINGKCPPDCPSGVSAINTLLNGEAEAQIKEVTLTGKAKSSDSGPGSLAMAALLISQADSPAPGPGDVIGAAMLIGAGVWWTVNQFTVPSTGYTTIGDPSAGYRSLKTEDTAEEDKDVNGVDVPEEGRRRKNRIPDKGEPNTVETNDPETTSKKYGPDGNVQKEYNKGHGPRYPKNEQDDHIHDYKPNPHNPTGRGERQPGRPPKKGELLRDFGIRK